MKINFFPDSNRQVFSGDFIEVTCENGIERVFLKGSVHTFLITDENKIRLTVEKRLGENNNKEKIQAGILEKDEMPLETAKRELLEELGLKAEIWQVLTIQSSIGTINDVRHYFIARQLTPVSTKLDGEVLGTIDYTLEELYEKAMGGGGFSPMSQAAIAKLHFEVSRGNIVL